MSSNIQSSLIKQAKAIGISLANPKIQEHVFKWIKKQSKNVDLSDLNLVFFDNHEVSVAEKVLNHNPKFLTLFETDQRHAEEQKKCISNIKSQFPNTEIHAYHASMANFLVPSKSTPINEELLKHIFPVDIKDRSYKEQIRHPKPYKSLLIGCLAFPNQQQQLVDSLFDQLLAHYAMPNVVSLYNFHRFGVITFLHALVLTKLICGFPDFEELDFYNRSYQHLSYLFHLLFEVELLEKGRAFETELFEPGIPEVKKITHEEHIKEAGFALNALYPIQIKPRRAIQISDLNIKFPEINRKYMNYTKKSQLQYNMQEIGNDGFDYKDLSATSYLSHFPSKAEQDALIELSFWLEFTGKISRNSIIDDKLRELLKDPSFSLFGAKTKASQLAPSEYADAFTEFRSKAKKANLEELMNAYRLKLFKDHVTSDYID